MASSDVFSTLTHVTDIKLSKLVRRQQAYETEKAALLDKAAQAPTLVSQTLVLAEYGVNRTNFKPEALGISVATIMHLLRQSAHDPSITIDQISRWNRILKHSLDCQTRRFELTALFSGLVTELIKHPNVTNIGPDPSASGDDFESVGRSEMHRQRSEWEEYAFSSRDTDSVAIRKYLDELFAPTRKANTKLEKTPIGGLQETLRKVQVPHMNEKDVKSSIKSLLAADLFAGAKYKALEGLLPLDSLLREIADVLNHDLDFIEEWQWENVPIRLEMRRALNGKYRVYMDEEIYQAILIHYIGSQWAWQLKAAFRTFLQSGAWLNGSTETMTKADQERRDFFLSESESDDISNLHDAYRSEFDEKYFMVQLPDSLYTSGGYDVDTKAGTGTGNIKQSILRRVATDSLINSKLYGEFTVLQSDFKWFGPSMPHSTLRSVLGYLGISGKWLDFFDKFLKAPLTFAQDGENAPPQHRKSGIPMSHALSDALGEAILFPLDFAVNQRTGGTNLFRFHDDLWIWGSTKTCETAWATMKEFTSIMGLGLNMDKTGTVIFRDDESQKKSVVPKNLPKGKITWGFLELSPATGQWVIDQDQVDLHIEEIKRQLASCRSILAIVAAYNAYVARFLLNNFGKPASCLGRPHVEEVVRTLSRVNKAVFPDSDGNVSAHLRKLVKQRFPAAGELPNGFFYFPQAVGGLDLKNPLIVLQLQWSSAKSDDPGKMVDDALEEDENSYIKAKEKWEKKLIHGKRPESVREDEGFMPIEEFMRFRELRSPLLKRGFESLMEELEVKLLPASGDLRALFGHVHELDGTPVNQAMLHLYGEDVVKYCGTLMLGEPDMLPAGLLEMLQSEKVRWQG